MAGTIIPIPMGIAQYVSPIHKKMRYKAVVATAMYLAILRKIFRSRGLNFLAAESTGLKMQTLRVAMSTSTVSDFGMVVFCIVLMENTEAPMMEKETKAHFIAFLKWKPPQNFRISVKGMKSTILSKKHPSSAPQNKIIRKVDTPKRKQRVAYA